MSPDEANQQGETPAATTAPAETASTSTNTSGSGEKPPWGDDFNPERAWSTIQKLRKYEDEAAALRKEKEDQDKAAADAERKRMAENQEYQKLAEQTQAELDNLKPEAERAKRYEAELQAIYEAELATLTDEGREMVNDSGHTDMIDKLAYIRKHAAKLKPQDTKRMGIEDNAHANGHPQTAADIKNKYLKQAGVT